MPEGPRPDWRNTDAQPSEIPGARRWKAKEPELPGPKLPSRRFLRRAIILTSVVGLAIGIAVLLRYLRGTPSACLVVVGSGYEHNLLLPHNICGWNGSLNVLNSIGGNKEKDWERWFREQFRQGSGIRTAGHLMLAENTWPEIWQEIADRIKKGESAKEHVILYFSAHGYADENEAYLLRDVPVIKSPEEFNRTRVQFKEILESLKEVPKKKNILLLLDVCHVQSHWPIGMLQNDFVERLQNKYKADIEAMENLTVICSTSPGQRSWASEERQTSIFADYVSKGLRGDGKQVDERITTEWFFGYLKGHVNQWAKANRAREQIPVRIGAADPELGPMTKLAVMDAKLGIEEAAKEDQKKDVARKADATAKYLDDLKVAWTTWMELRRDYAPHVYAPHYWRLYQETLLRYEQLKRAGDPTQKAGALKTKLNDLEKEIRAEKALDKGFECLGNSFPLSRVLGFHPDGGFVPKEDPRVLALLDQLNKNSIDPKKWAIALKPFEEKKPLERRYWQTELSRLFLREQLAKKILNEHLAKKNLNYIGISENLTKLANDLGAVPQRAAEVHLVKMLQGADVSLKKQPDLILQAMRVRMLAEVAALGDPDEGDSSELYAEAVFEQKKEDIKEADRKRRNGEDLLVGNPQSQNEARAELDLAKKAYDAIHSDTKKLRLAMALRDDISAELPFFAAALASLQPVDERTKKDIDTLRIKAESLGTSLALLIKSLDKLGEPPPIKTIQDDLDHVRDHYREMCEKLCGFAPLQKNWHALDTILGIPPAASSKKEVDLKKVDLRIDLLKKLRETSLTLDALKNPDAQTEKPENTLEWHRKLLRSSLKPYEDEIQGAELKKNVDDNIRKFLLSQYEETAKESADAEKELTLQSAVGRSRVLLGCLADQLKEKNDGRINPAKRLRQLQSYHLLLGLARRTLEDHWWEPGEDNKESYYVPAARAYLAAAETLEAKGAKKIDERKELETRLKIGGLALLGAPNRFWTTEPNFALNCSVEAESGVPAGRPTVWFEGPKGRLTERETPLGWPTTEYKAKVSLDEKNEDFVKHGKVPVALHALYRGQHVTKKLDVERPAPNVIARHTPGPSNVAFAVRMKNLDYGAVSIVLDNSGSMRTRHPKKGKDQDAKEGEDSRFDYAIKALEQVLNALPDDTYLSISRFGNNEKRATAPQFVDLPSNTSDKPFIQWQRSPRRVKQLAADLKNDFKNNSNNASPIASAIIHSMEKGFPELNVPKLVVVLTDGMDNFSSGEYAKIEDKAACARNTSYVKDALQKAKANHPGVDVVVVCFIDSKEDLEFDYAKDQFGIYDKQGRLIPEAEGAKLGRIIETCITPHVKLQFKNGDDAPGFAFGQPVNYLSEAVLSWHPLTATDYMASLMNTRATRFNVKLAPGQNLLTTLRREEGKFIMERGVVGLQPEVGKNNCLKAQKEDWLVTLLKNKNPFGTESRSQLVAFEKTSDRGRIEQVHPGFVWLELEGKDGIKPEKTEWGNDLVVPAPAYKVDVDRWAGGNPTLRAWFWPGDWENLLKGLDIKAKNISIQNHVPDGDIEKVEQEYRTVGIMTSTGTVKPEKIRCLVIRARYPPGEPVYIGLKRKNEYVGSEHQYFHQAGKCTACFYDLRGMMKDDVEVVVIPVSRFKQIGANVVFQPRSDSIDVPNIFYQAITHAK
jgi:hypothetical protein